MVEWHLLGFIPNFAQSYHGGNWSLEYSHSMSAGPRNFLTPTEPNENRGGYRRFKRGEGAASIWGVGSNRASDFKMNCLGVIFLLICLGVPVSAVMGAIADGGWSPGTFWGCLVIAHLFLMVSEMTTHREIPARGRGLLLCWVTFLAVLISPSINLLPF